MTGHVVKSITNHTELKLRIEQLHALKVEQEAKIKTNIKEISHSMNPEVILKSAWHNITGNPETQQGIGKAGLSLGINYFIGKLTGRNPSVKSYLASVVLEKVTTHLLNKHSGFISTGIGKLTKLFKRS